MLLRSLCCAVFVAAVVAASCSCYFCQRWLIVAVDIGTGSILRFLPQVAVAAFVATGWSLPSIDCCNYIFLLCCCGNCAVISCSFCHRHRRLLLLSLPVAVAVTAGCCCCHRRLLFFCGQLAVAAFCNQLLLLFCRRQLIIAAFSPKVADAASITMGCCCRCYSRLHCSLCSCPHTRCVCFCHRRLIVAFCFFKSC